MQERALRKGGAGRRALWHWARTVLVLVHMREDCVNFAWRTAALSMHCAAPRPVLWTYI
jgi:hypothetical protein